MENIYEIEFYWNREDGENEEDIPDTVTTLLNEHALDRSSMMYIVDGYKEGELCEVLDDITYRGWWKINLREKI